MALLKSPSKQPKTTNLQVRLEEEVRRNLDRYAPGVPLKARTRLTLCLRLSSSYLGKMTSSSDGQTHTTARNQ